MLPHLSGLMAVSSRCSTIGVGLGVGAATCVTLVVGTGEGEGVGTEVGAVVGAGVGEGVGTEVGPVVGVGRLSAELGTIVIMTEAVAMPPRLSVTV